MHVHVVDPSAYTPPYDHALCRALGAAGAEVELFTSRFAYGAVPLAEGYARHKCFYRLAHRGTAAGRRSRANQALKLAEHVPDMLRYRRAARTADVVHFQWLTVQPLDVHLLPRRRPTPAGERPKLVLTAHDVLPREPRAGQLRAQRRLYGRFDAVVVHSEHGRERLVRELGVDPARVHVIPHGALTHLAELPADRSRETLAFGSRPRFGQRADGGVGGLPFQADGPVVLFFGLLRPYKGLDVLLRAWRGAGGQGVGSGCGEGVGIDGAQLWIAGMPRMDLTALDAAHGGVLSRSRVEQSSTGSPLGQHTPFSASNTSGAPNRGRREAHDSIRFVPRFIPDAELPAYFRRADLVVLPYLEADQSGVLSTALAFGKPLLLSDVGGFPEVAATGAARTVPAGDPAALRAALRELLGDPAKLAEMAACARAAASGPYSWEAVARAHLEVYGRLLA
jgi:glycosyltransferase involved in cell wall biosynthesis